MQIDFYTFSGIFVYGGIASAFVIFIDTMKRPQEMKIMKPVWILTGLWGSYIGLLVYALIGRSDERGNDKMDMGGMDMNMDTDMKMNTDKGMQMSAPPVHISPLKVALSTLHCGAGCTLADLIGETITIALPLAVAGSVLAGQWTLDYVLALLIGVLFQYAAIQPMLHLKAGKALARALRVDFLSLTAWQIGMYGWMAIAIFVIYGQQLPKNTVEFWFMMQIAMCCGFLTAYPVNWFLIKKGIKPSM